MDSTRRHILDLSRRRLLFGATAASALTAILPAVSRTAIANPVFSAYPFSLGVASGDPWPDGVVLWTRLAPQPLVGGGMPRAAVPVRWQVADDSGFATIVRQGSALARPELGHTVHVEVDGLSPARPYFYRFIAGTEVRPAAPAPRRPWTRRPIGCAS